MKQIVHIHRTQRECVGCGAQQRTMAAQTFGFCDVSDDGPAHILRLDINTAVEKALGTDAHVSEG